MRKLVAILALFLTSISLAQTPFNCGTAYTPPSGTSGKALPTPPPIDPNKKYVINVYFHLLNNTDGTNYLGPSWDCHRL